MNFESAINTLDQAGVEYELVEHETFLTMDAVEQSGLFEMDRALKTLLFELRGETVATVLLGHQRLDYRLLAQACGMSRSSVKPLDAQIVEAQLGDVPGGVCPFHQAGVRVLVDDSIAGIGRVSCGAGRPDRTFHLDIGDLITVADAQLVPLAKRQ